MTDQHHLGRIIPTMPSPVERIYWVSLFPQWSTLFPSQVFFQGPHRLEIALTFDNGPDPVLTPLILDTLFRYKVKATFMCLGKHILQNPQILERIVKEGHIVGNHTWDHLALTKLPHSEAVKQVESTAHIIHRFTGQKPQLFRPPFGALNPSIVRDLISMNYKVILWNTDSLDWVGLTGPQITANIIAPIKPGSIVLLHDDSFGHLEQRLGTVQALPYLIEILRQKGYRFMTIPELFQLQIN